MSENDGMNFEINFTDNTMLEANGEFDEVTRLMNKPDEFIGSLLKPIMSDRWAIKSTVTILHGLGFAAITCDFYNDGKVVVIDYQPSSKDLYCVDIRCLTAWAISYGWKHPEPLPHVIDEWRDFWVMQWETKIIDSEYLDKKLGKRKEMLPADPEDDEEDVVDADIYDDDIDKYRA